MDYNSGIANMLSLFINEAVRTTVEQGYAVKYKEEEFNKLLSTAIKNLMGEILGLGKQGGSNMLCG
ncbi:hypothetical protein ACLHDF_22515 [Priestia aryabhattai]|uniref:hypothetical protein n=1 Tax=Priestia megaterium TaxID=1404 RepID=UPI0039B9CDF6